MSLVRSFIAIEIEDRATLAKLIEARDRLTATGADIKPVEDQNIHLTLRFLGEIPISLVNWVCSELRGVEYNKFSMHVKGLGAFPTIQRPRVIWAGIAEGSQHVVELHKKIEDFLKKRGIEPEREEFIPHITLARVKGSRGINELVKAVLAMVDSDFGITPVSRVVLKKSVLTPRGPIYSDICAQDLK